MLEWERELEASLGEAEVFSLGDFFFKCGTASPIHIRRRIASPKSSSPPFTSPTLLLSTSSDHCAEAGHPRYVDGDAGGEGLQVHLQRPLRRLPPLLRSPLNPSWPGNSPSQSLFV